jgi:hypothetical protein
MKLELANRAIDFDYKNEEEESLLTLAAEYPDKTVYSSLKASFGRG